MAPSSASISRFIRRSHAANFAAHCDIHDSSMALEAARAEDKEGVRDTDEADGANDMVEQEGLFNERQQSIQPN
jgi:hypothetical protein